MSQLWKAWFCQSTSLGHVDGPCNGHNLIAFQFLKLFILIWLPRYQPRRTCLYRNRQRPGDLNHPLVLQITPTLLPELLSTFKQPNLYDTAVRKQAVSVMRKLVNNCTEVMGTYKIQAQQVVQPHLSEWLQELGKALEESITPQVSVHIWLDFGPHYVIYTDWQIYDDLHFKSWWCSTEEVHLMSTSKPFLSWNSIMQSSCSCFLCAIHRLILWECWCRCRARTSALSSRCWRLWWLFTRSRGNICKQQMQQSQEDYGACSVSACPCMRSPRSTRAAMVMTTMNMWALMHAIVRLTNKNKDFADASPACLCQCCIDVAARHTSNFLARKGHAEVCICQFCIICSV